MSCADCDRAKVNPTRDAFTAHCEGCKARALAAIGAHIESQALKVITPQYRTALEKVFGERWKQGAELTKQWAERIEAAAKHGKVKT